MRILCIHQNYPGQFRDITPQLLKKGHDVRAICGHKKPVQHEIDIRRYEINKDKFEGDDKLVREIQEWLSRSKQVAHEAKEMKKKGWAPDVILVHPGWGESLLIKKVFPSSQILVWPELWLKSDQIGCPQKDMTIEQWQYLKMKNSLTELAISEASRIILPTQYQANSFPEKYKSKISVIHEGVSDDLLGLERIKELHIGEDISLKSEIPVVTFISRNLEPMRGFHVMMRSLPALQERNREVHVVIVGGDDVSYSSQSGDGNSWKNVMLSELEGKLDMERIHFISRLEHQDLKKLYLRSDLHLYLSSEFVLSWSLTEIMACGTPILGLNNAMLRDVVIPGVTGALYYGSEEGLGHATADLLKNKQQLRIWGDNCRDFISKNMLLSSNIETLTTLFKPYSSHF